MAEERREKHAIRLLWLEEVAQASRAVPDPSEPLYLTLPGAEGRDIQLIVESGLVNLTEVGSIADADKDKIIAVENSNDAILTLQKRFAGLNIKEAPFQSLIRGDGLFTWPMGRDERYCRASVVNLDMNTPLVARIDDGNVVFPVLSWIRKLCQIHGRPPRKEWVLCLTLHADIPWQPEAQGWATNFLRENLAREPTFATRLEVLREGQGPSYSDLPGDEKQKVLMALVPKTIAHLVHIDGWRVSTKWNLRYGGGPHAHMVTWGIKLDSPDYALAAPDALYRDSLRGVLASAGAVSSNGEILFD
jgi:hypothetical protein